MTPLVQDNNINNTTTAGDDPLLLRDDNSKHKRAKFLVRTNSKKGFGGGGRDQRSEGRHLMPLFGMLCCVYIFLNVTTSSGQGGMSSGNMLLLNRALATTAKEDNQGILDVVLAQEHGHRRLRALSSVYNKNSDPLVKVIKDEEWEEHAYLPIPKLEIAEDDHIWPKVHVEKEEVVEKVQEQEVVKEETKKVKKESKAKKAKKKA